MNKKKIVNIVKQIDVFKQPVLISIKKETHHKTLYGAISSIVIIIIIFIQGMQQILAMIKRNQLNIITSEFYDPQPKLEILNPNNFTFTFGLEDGDTFHTFVDKSFINVSAKFLYKYSTLQPDGSTLIKIESEDISSNTCDQNQIKQPEMKEYLKNFNLKTQFCLGNEKPLKLQGTYDSEHYRFLEVHIKQCLNGTQDVICMPQNIIEQRLNKMFFAFQISDSIVDLKQAYIPHKTIGKDFFTTASNKIVKYVDVYLQPIVTETDVGVILESIEMIESLRIQQAAERTDFSIVNPGDTFFKLTLRLDNRRIINYRKCLKLTDVLSNLGGLWNVLFVSFLIILSPINHLSQSELLINSVFNFDQLDESTNRASQIYRNSELQNIIKNKRKVIPEINSSKMQRQQTDQDYINQIKYYFKSTKNKLVLTVSDYIQLFFCFFKKGTNDIKRKKQQLQYATKRLKKSLDIVYIMTKLNEIDQMKSILFNHHQQKLFEYLDKPRITCDPEKQSSENADCWSMLKDHNFDYKRTTDAFKSYLILKTSTKHRNKKFLQFLDQRAKNYFMAQYQLNNPIQFEEMDYQFKMQFDKSQSELQRNEDLNCQLNQQYLVSPLESNIDSQLKKNKEKIINDHEEN